MASELLLIQIIIICAFSILTSKPKLVFREAIEQN